MMSLNENLLFTDNNYNSIHDGSNIKGSYSTIQFAIRLRSDIRKALDKDDNSPECIQAKSTSLHENVHWWQHIGSSFGLILSLSQPSLIHVIKEHLSDEELKFKSLLKLEKLKFENEELDRSSFLNLIINNYYDQHYAQLFAFHNPNLEEITKDRRFFMHMGYCYRFLWGNVIRVISSTIDRDNNFLQDPDDWRVVWDNLEKNKVEGFYIGTPMGISPIGVREIFEGQARFIQLQYLTSSLNSDLTIQDFENHGLLHGVYRTAYDLFIEVTGINQAYSAVDSCIGLFLLVCDMSINPDNGFPSDLKIPELFIRNNDPGCRFVDMLIFIRDNKNKINFSISDYSKEEYINLERIISEGVWTYSTYESIHSTVSGWLQQESIQKLLHEDSKSEFSEGNLPIKVLLAKFINFQIDKYKNPQIFCWFGRHGHPNTDDEIIEFVLANKMYLKHHCLFTDDYDGEIKPVIFDGIDPVKSYETFNQFYGYALNYDLVMKWINEEGPFNFNYKWLLGNRSSQSEKDIKQYFSDTFKFDIDEIQPI